MDKRKKQRTAQAIECDLMYLLNEIDFFFFVPYGAYTHTHTY